MSFIVIVNVNGYDDSRNLHLRTQNSGLKIGRVYGHFRVRIPGAIFGRAGCYFTFLISGLKNLRNFTVVSYNHSNCLCQSLRSW